MIVVAIVGILAAVAIPNYVKYQAKARQSEAKIALAGIFTAEKSVFAEYGSHSPCLGLIGYLPDSISRFYAVGFATNAAADIAGLPACTAAAVLASTNFNNVTATSVGLWGGTLAANSGSLASIVGSTAFGAAVASALIGTDTFTAVAGGSINRATNVTTLYDAWTMNDGRALSNAAVGI
jgi:type IV pilus assembly protein PilA